MIIIGAYVFILITITCSNIQIIIFQPHRKKLEIKNNMCNNTDDVSFTNKHPRFAPF